MLPWSKSYPMVSQDYAAWVTEHKFYFSRVRGDIETGLAFPGCIISQTLVHARPYRKEKKSSWPKVGTVNGHRVR